MTRKIFISGLCSSALLWGAIVCSMPVQGDGMTPLHWAAYNDNLELAKALIAAGANVSAKTRINGMTPLFMAAQNANAQMIDALLKAGADANATLSTGVTALMYASRAGSADGVKLLIENGAEVDAKENTLGETALMFAAANNRAEVIKVLMEHGAKTSNATKVVDIAAKAAAAGRGRGRGNNNTGNGGNMDEERPPRIDVMGGLTALLFAARQGHIEAAKALIEAGANINEVSPGDKTSPLLMASINGHFDLAKYLLDKGADPRLASTAGATPLYTTMSLKWAPKTDYPQPETAREHVNYLDLMQAFLDHGADPNARLVKELWFTNYNFDLSQVVADGATTLWRAAQVADVAAMRLLVKAGADPTIRNNDQVSPLHVAAGLGVHGNDEVTAPGGWMAGVRYLVDELHADVNEVDKNGFTALHSAAARGDDEMIIFLAQHGARVDAVAKNGQTVVDMANGPRQRIQPFPKTIELLVSLGGKNSNKCVSC